jgi:uncharacterized membrane protein YphA (DoxX/SURF4 family)
MQAKLSIALRLFLGLIFCYAAYTKLRQPWLVFAMSIDAYRVLPAWAVFDVARTLPWFELAVGILLLSGKLLKYAAVSSSLLLAVFYALMIRAYIAGGGIDCGCFGVGETVSAVTLTRDGLLLACALGLSFLAFRTSGSKPSHQGILRPVAAPGLPPAH